MLPVVNFMVRHYVDPDLILYLPGIQFEYHHAYESVVPYYNDNKEWLPENVLLSEIMVNLKDDLVMLPGKKYELKRDPGRYNEIYWPKVNGYAMWEYVNGGIHFDVYYKYKVGGSYIETTADVYIFPNIPATRGEVNVFKKGYSYPSERAKWVDEEIWDNLVVMKVELLNAYFPSL